MGDFKCSCECHQPPQEKDCICKEPWTMGVIHRTDGPCYWPSRDSEQEPPAAFQPQPTVERRKKVESGAKDFAERFEPVMRELAEEATVEPWEKEFAKMLSPAGEEMLLMMVPPRLDYAQFMVLENKKEEIKSFIHSTLKEAQKEVIEETVEKIELIASQINSEREGAKQAKQALHEAISLLTQKKNTL